MTTVQGEPEAEVLCGLLRANGIECGHRQTAEEDSPFENIATDGMREILVRPEDLDAARQLLNEEPPASRPPTA